MKYYLEKCSTAHRHLLSVALVASLALPLPALAASVALATSPLATTTTSSVKPNVFLMMDDSGSMGWAYLPDGAKGFSANYGYASSQCNGVYYDPAITYVPPVNSTGTSYPNSSFTAAWIDGYNTGSGTTNLSTSFIDTDGNGTNNSGFSAQAAFYYTYSGAQTTNALKDYFNTASTFYRECNSAIGSAPGNAVFTKVVVGAGEQTNFANWYSYYRTRINMMKTATGLAFQPIGANYRVGFATMNNNGGTDFINPATFDAAQKLAWYNKLYATSAGSSTPLLGALADIGKIYAHKLTSKNGVAVVDPVQYSCQQNFTILTTDGYWNSQTGDTQLDGSTPVGNQDGTAGRPMHDGAQAGTTVTTTYTRNNYSTSSSGLGADAQCPKVSGTRGKRLINQPEIQSCSVTGGAAAICTPWNSNGSPVYVAPYDVCTAPGSITVPSPNPSTRVVSGTPVTTAGTSGGTSNTLADVAMYYYQTDLRTSALSNCTGATAGEDVCTNNVFISTLDNNTQQHMTTFTLGLGAKGRMVYSSSYLTDTTGDYAAVKLGSTANLAPSAITVSGAGSTSVSSIMVNGVQLMSGTSTADTSTSAVAANIAAKITLNGFSATSSGNVVTITGPASAAGFTPVITQSGGMTLTTSTTMPVCSWQANGTVCNWPIPDPAGTPENIDDLWHAAVDGRGAYFNASNPATLSTSLSNALSGINTRRGAAAAAATSTLNPVAGNNFAYVASYTTSAWKGNLEARGINVDTGVVSVNANWCAENVTADTCVAPGTIVPDTNGSTTIYNCVTPNSVTCAAGTLVGTDCKVPMATACTGTMNAKVADASDTRMILTANSTGTALTNFDTVYRAANPTNFDAAHISTLSQWTSLTAAQQTAATGDNLLNYLRGQHGYESDRTANPVANWLYRYREAVLGDALESQPAFIGPPVFSYPYTGYSAYVTAQAARAGTVYMGANDGMMHAFAADTGIERWAYVPSMVIPNMWQLADKNYATLHRNFVNGSPITSDIYCPGNCGGVVDAIYGSSASWRTILVAGLNGGGRGYYALDITAPTAPTLLWEFTTTAGIGAVKDDDLGYSFGQPIITRKADGTWVVLVTSGYNNTSPGSGIGYLYVLNANTGAIISKISTGVGSAATPSGLAKIVGWNDEPAGNKVGYIYGGDLLGNVWRFNINSTVAATIGTGDKLKFATLFSDAAATLPQPVTTTPVLGSILGKRIIFIGTGKYLESGDLTTTQIQTQYAIKDDNATTTLVNPRTTLVQQTLTNAGASRTVSNNAVDFFTGRGWYVNFPDSGERVNIDSKLVQGTLLVPSIVPSSTACTPGGYGWLNFFNFQTGGPVNTATGTASLKYDATIVGVNVLYVQGVPKVGVVTSTNPTPELNTGVNFAATATGFTGKRVIWRELIP
ncbi:MAG: PilC/PilY family type IV pilus protein [Gallionella sp.]|nr:PilC/PilY family type IV pilus protein [Gallionella sp.]